MSQTVTNLGFVPKERGDYNSNEKYYKDNIVQYNGSSYIADPVGYDVEHPESSYNQGVAPWTINPNTLNAGWRVFASGNNTFSTGETVDTIGIDNEPLKDSPNIIKSSAVYDAVKGAKLYAGDVAIDLFELEGGYYEDNSKNNINKCTTNYYQADTIWGNKYKPANNIVSGIYWLARNANLDVSIYKVNIVNKETTLIKEVPYDGTWQDGQLIKIEFDSPVILLENEYIGIDAPIRFTDTLTDETGKSFFLYRNYIGGNDNTAIGLYCYCSAKGKIEDLEEEISDISLATINDSNIENKDNWVTSYYTPGPIFCPDESVNVGKVSGVTWKCNKRVGEEVNFYKCNILNGDSILIKKYVIPSDTVDGDLIDIPFDEEIIIGENEAIGIGGPLYYNDGHGGSYQINGTTVRHNAANIGISTFVLDKIDIPEELNSINDSINQLDVKVDQIQEELGGEPVKTYSNNIQRADTWTDVHNVAGFIFCPDDLVNIGKVDGVAFKCNKQIGSDVNIYKASIINGEHTLLATRTITSSDVDGEMIDLQFDSPVTINANECLGIEGPIYFDNGSTHYSYQITLGGTITHNGADIGLVSFSIDTKSIIGDIEKLDERVTDLENELGSIGTIIPDNTNLQICNQQYYQANTVWGNTYKLGSSPIYGIIWKIRKYNDLGISIYKVNSTNAAMELLETIPYDDSWVEGNELVIEFDNPIVLSNVEYIGIDAPIYYNDRLAEGEGAEFFVHGGSYNTNSHTLVGVQTFTRKIEFKELSALSESNRIKNKIIAWYGTSIPAGEPHTDKRDVYSYANIAVKRLGGTILNYCVSGSCLISKENTESTTYNNIRFSDLTAPVNYQNSMLDLIGTPNEPEWFVFDFGANDAAFYKSQFDALDFDNLDFTSTDKKTFLGAFNLVIKSLLQAKPKAKIILVTHFSDDSVNGTHEDYYLNLNKLIRRIGEYWQIPVNDMSHKCGFMYRNGINTLNAYMPIDGLHPGNNLEVVHLLADIHCKFLLNV